MYLFDKNRVRIGEGYISLNNVGVAETVKFQVGIDSAGAPASFGLAARDLPQGMGPPQAARKVSITVNSVFQGALIKLDGTEVGTTPKIVEVSAGKHRLDFSKEGFNAGAFPLEIGSNDTSGGSVMLRVGISLVHDTVELRDGSVISGDLESVSATEVVLRIAGKDARYDRNQVKRILLVERESSAGSPAARGSEIGKKTSRHCLPAIRTDGKLAAGGSGRGEKRRGNHASQGLVTHDCRGIFRRARFRRRPVFHLFDCR